MEKNFENIIFSVENKIANITLNREKALNALDDKITFELSEAFEMCKSDEIKVVVLSAKGKGFSSGGDIKLMTKLESEPNILNDLLENLHKVVIQMRNLNKPIIAAINGFAFGAGFSLALACDFRIATKNSSYSCAFVNIGLVPDTGASFFLTKYLGASKATELMMLGNTINSEEAYKLGLLNKLVNDDELESTVNSLASELSKKPSGSLARVKQLVNRAIISDLSDQLSLEAMYQGEVVKLPDFREGITAFMQKRKPEFK
jgi:2-(1,2-epoxy-1,2-dihydrophenyl)acetyl-CoA isomerase